MVRWVNPRPSILRHLLMPSDQCIHKVEGVQVYNYSVPSKGVQYSIWSRPAKGGHFSYVLKSDTDIAEQLDFAKEVVKNY